MEFQLKEAIEILERTPAALENFLSGLSTVWLECNEGEGTWNPSEVLRHLIEAEKNNWITRLEFILKEGEDKPFPAFDRFSHINKRHRKTVEQELAAFKILRNQNIAKLKKLIGKETLLEKTGSHPAFGAVKVRELISTWVVHDMSHICQIVRAMSERYREDVGSWKQYLGILKDADR